MTKIARLKCVLLALLFISTVSVMVIYVANISQLDSQRDQTSQPIVFQVQKDNGSIVLTRLVYIERQNRLQAVCKHRNISASPVEDNLELLDHVIVDEEHKLLYCYVPKVACTNWKRVFMILQQKTNISIVDDIPASLAHSQGMFMKLANYSNSEIQQILQSYTKFIFVRHPFERLLSAYRNKLEQHYKSSKYFQERYGRYIVKNYRPNASEEALIKGDDVSFKEFSLFLTDKNAVFNEHWKPIYNLCQPCSINYDIVGKYETLHEDADFILKHIGQSHIQFPKLRKPSSTMSRLTEYFKTLPPEMVEQLYNIYKIDFDLFGYETPNFF